MNKNISFLALLALMLPAMPCTSHAGPVAPQDAALDLLDDEADISTAPETTPFVEEETPEPLPDQRPSAQQALRPPVQTGPTFLQSEERNAARMPANRAPSSTQAPEQSTATAQPEPVGTQLAFFELTPSVGSISIKGVSAFSVGSDLSFHLTRSSPFYFEPSLFVSFLPGDTNSPNATLFHLDGGLRYDIAIANSPLVPFLKLAAGPTISTSSSTVVHGEKVSNGYINVFAGGGAKVLISPSIAARADVGITLQGTDTGIYAMGAVALPL